MTQTEAMDPDIKTTIASDIISLYEGVPNNILLLPSRSMHDHKRLAQTYPNANYFAVERDEVIAGELNRSGKFERVYYCDLKYADFEDISFDIAYLDLAALFSYNTCDWICEFLRSYQFSVIPDRGQLLVITLLQSPTRGAYTIHPKSDEMKPKAYLRHVRDALRKELNIAVRSEHVFSYSSGIWEVVTCFLRIKK